MTVLWPNGTLTQPKTSGNGAFGPRKSPGGIGSTNHRGWDSIGYPSVRAVADGTVIFAGVVSGWTGLGYSVWIQHDGFFSKSGHLKSAPAVRAGQRVAAGDVLGTMGMTGTATGVHLHLEISPGKLHKRNEGQVDPIPFIRSRLASTAGSGGTPVSPPPSHTPNYPLLEEDDMPPVIKHPDRNEWSLLDPGIGKGLPRFVYGQTPEYRSEKTAGGVVNTYRGFYVTTDPNVGAAWGRNYCRAYGNAPSVAVSDVDYKTRQAEASRLSHEKHGE